MPIPAIEIQVAEIHVKGLMDSGGSDAIRTDWTFHYRRTADAPDPSKDALHTKFVAAAGPLDKIALALNERWNASEVTIRWIDDAQDAPKSYTDAHGGAITGDALQSDQAAFLLHRTALRGRSFRGSKHLGPMSESDVTAPDDDIWNAGCLTRLATINTALLTPLTDSVPLTWVYCILSRKESQLLVNPTTVVVNDVMEGLVNKRVGNMKRRHVKSVY